MKYITKRCREKEGKDKYMRTRKFRCDNCWCEYESNEFIDDKENFLYVDKCPNCRKEVCETY